MRCPRCGNENPETNRFCGMCGGSLLQASAAAPASAALAVAPKPSSIPAPVAVPTPPPPPTAPTDPPEATPTISGPSFLGLNAPAPSPKRSDPLSINPSTAPSSRNLDYLLDDEEEPRRSGSGKFVLIAVALALAVGLGYLRWKNQNFGWLRSGAHKSTPTGQIDAPSADAPPTTSSGVVPPSSSTAQPSSPDVSQPAATASSGSTPPSTTLAPPAATPDSSQPPPAPASTTPLASTAPADSAPTPSAPKPSPAETAPKHDAPKPAPPKPVRTDSVTEAQKYIYGKGVKQDCDHGLRLLKPAADSENTKAMIEMGALYSSGLCTPRDLPTAYRWFAKALHKEPDNQSVQTDLQRLWGEMTQPERQLAIKQSQ